MNKSYRQAWIGQGREYKLLLDQVNSVGYSPWATCYESQ
jgi:hypothetical protein